jgi:hypothetical protein
MSVRCKLLSTSFLAILTLSLCILCVYPSAAQIDQTTSKLQVANAAVNQAFNGVLDAEKAGANVTGLLAQLNALQAFWLRQKTHTEAETPTLLQPKQTAPSQSNNKK